MATIKNESNELNQVIAKSKEASNKHKEELQLNYDDKLRKIKEICSQYFSKYEKELLNNQDKIKELDLKCEEWAKLIV